MKAFILLLCVFATALANNLNTVTCKHYKDTAGNDLEMPVYMYVNGCVNNNCQFPSNTQVEIDIEVLLDASASYTAVGAQIYVTFKVGLFSYSSPFPIGDVCSKLDGGCPLVGGVARHFIFDLDTQNVSGSFTFEIALYDNSVPGSTPYIQCAGATVEISYT